MRPLLHPSICAGIIATAILAVGAPFVANAQDSSADLRDAIRLSLREDSRTSELSAAELEAMVDILAARAGEEGITGGDIRWRPQSAPAPSPASNYCVGKSFLCDTSLAFGFLGNDTRIPAALALLSALLILLLSAYREHHHRELGVHPTY